MQKVIDENGTMKIFVRKLCDGKKNIVKLKDKRKY